MADTPPVWKRCLDFDAQDAAHYNDYVHEPLFALPDGEPRHVLDVGCATGAFGAALVQRFPSASVVGIEAARAAAQKAATRLDRVIHARLDDISFADHGLHHGEFDTVIASDILEHLMNPWDLLVRLRPFLAPGAQVLASIPNIRNITVVSSLALDGRFEYDERVCSTSRICAFSRSPASGACSPRPATSSSASSRSSCRRSRARIAAIKVARSRRSGSGG